MAGSLQTFLAKAVQSAAKDLETALFRVPEDKRNWSSMGDARSAIDMVAECAMLCDPTEIVTSRSFPSTFNFEEYKRNKEELAKDWNAVKSLLDVNVAKAAAFILTVPDEDLNIEIAFPWGNMTVAQVLSYPYWNMSYHEGQINYIASMLGCLE